jgi:hypothetical protein
MTVNPEKQPSGALYLYFNLPPERKRLGAQFNGRAQLE